MRRGREEFRKHVGETDKTQITEEKSIAMIERTSVVYGMYAPSHKSVVSESTLACRSVKSSIGV